MKKMSGYDLMPSVVGPDNTPAPSSKMAVGAVLAGMMLVVMNTAMATVALPTMAVELRVSPADATWILTAYQAGLLIAMLPCAALGEKFGYRGVFTWGLCLFAASSLACALAPTLGWLVAARLLQGIGGAAVMALGMALLRSIVSHQRLGAAIGWNASVVAFSSAAGPFIGTAIISVAQWPWLFSCTLPVVVVVLLATVCLPPSTKKDDPLDLFSMLLSVGVFAALIAALGMLASRSLVGAILLVFSIVQMWMLVKRERANSAPLVPIDLLKHYPLRVSVISSICCFSGQAAGMVALPFFLQKSLGLSNWVVSGLMAAWPLSVALMAPFSGALADRVSTAKLCLSGGMGLSAGLFIMSLVDSGVTWLLIPCVVSCGFGFSVFNVANNRSMFMGAPVQRSGAMGGLQGTARLVGQTSGAVIMSMLFNLEAIEQASRTGIAIGAILVLISALLSLLHPKVAREIIGKVG